MHDLDLYEPMTLGKHTKASYHQDTVSFSGIDWTIKMCNLPSATTRRLNMFSGRLPNSFRPRGFVALSCTRFGWHILCCSPDLLVLDVMKFN